MTDEAIKKLLMAGHRESYIANYGQCGFEQVRRVADSMKSYDKWCRGCGMALRKVYNRYDAIQTRYCRDCSMIAEQRMKEAVARLPKQNGLKVKLNLHRVPVIVDGRQIGWFDRTKHKCEFDEATGKATVTFDRLNYKVEEKASYKFCCGNCGNEWVTAEVEDDLGDNSLVMSDCSRCGVWEHVAK